MYGEGDLGVTKCGVRGGVVFDLDVEIFSTFSSRCVVLRFRFIQLPVSLSVDIFSHCTVNVCILQNVKT